MASCSTTRPSSHTPPPHTELSGIRDIVLNTCIDSGDFLGAKAFSLALLSMHDNQATENYCQQDESYCRSGLQKKRKKEKKRRKPSSQKGAGPSRKKEKQKCFNGDHDETGDETSEE